MRTGARLAVDVGFVAAVIACSLVVAANADRPPPVPAGVCTPSGDAPPRYGALADDGRITVTAVFGEIAAGPGDPGMWSYHALAGELEDRGFIEREPDHFTLAEGGLRIEVSLAPPTADRDVLAARLDRALADSDVVYYNGHEYDGQLPLRAPATGYRIVVLDTCWSTQSYAARLLGPNVDVVSNTERAVTGSVESFAALLDGLRIRTRSWRRMLSEMNELADARAVLRAPFSRFRRAEHYRLDVACR